MTRVLLVAMVSLVLGVLGLQADKPTQSQVPNDTRAAKQDGARKSQQPSEADKNNTRPIVETQAARETVIADQEPTSPELKYAASQPDENTQIQRRLVTVTIWLVIVGLLQFVALTVQVVVFCRTLKAINRQARIMVRQTRIAKADAKATRESIILTHRPKLIIRSIVVPGREILRRKTPLDALTRSGLDDGQLGGFLYAVNVGNQPATIRALDEYYFFGDILPMERPYEPGSEQRLLSITLEPGEARKILLRPELKKADGISASDIYDRSLWVVGRITYSDELGNSRETGFCRQVDRQHARMLPVSNPDYEYAD